ncbi:hypothetical protein L6R52_18195 [Myxococcota bacterium]|nr:hypothetical protein [Myxococcota bacterium]
MNKTILILCSVAGLALLTACDDNDECRELRSTLKARKDILNSARAQSNALEIAQKRAAAAEGNATKLLKALWLSEPETRIQDTLEKRARVVSDAIFVRGAQAVGGERPGDPTSSETMWTIRFREADLQRAFRYLDEVTATPPLVRFATMVRESRDSADWRIELLRAAAEQVPINPQPVLLPPPADLSAVKRQIGFCGAGKLRDEIEEADAELKRLKERAEKTTVLLPTAASYDGLRARAELLRDIELENRRHLRLFREAVVASGVPLKGLGVEGTMAVVELFGGTKERAAFMLEVDKLGAAAAVQEPKNQKEGVLRFGLLNKISEARRVRMEQGARPMQPGDPLPADHPDSRERGGHDHP